MQRPNKALNVGSFLAFFSRRIYAGNRQLNEIVEDVSWRQALLEIWDKMAEIMQITFQYSNQIRL